MLSALRTRWLRVPRGWRIAIVTILGTLVVVGGTGFFLYQRTALAREFDATLLGLTRLAASKGDKLALTDDQVKRVLVPLHRLEIQDSIQPDDARQALAEIRAALTADQLAAISQARSFAAGGLRFAGGVPRPGRRQFRRPGPLARMIALFRVQLPQPALVSQICQRLEDRLNGTAQTPTN